MINVFVGSTEEYADVEPVTQYAIESNTNNDVRIHFVRPPDWQMRRAGATGFTFVRYAVPELLRMTALDYGIYLDVDMLVVGDIAELWDHRQPGRVVCLRDGSNEVSIWHRAVETLPPRERLHEYSKSDLHRRCRALNDIPRCWNVEDRIEPGMKLLHFTDVNRQPWRGMYPHPSDEAVAVWNDYRARSMAPASGDDGS